MVEIFPSTEYSPPFPRGLRGASNAPRTSSRSWEIHTSDTRPFMLASASSKVTVLPIVWDALTKILARMRAIRASQNTGERLKTIIITAKSKTLTTISLSLLGRSPRPATHIDPITPPTPLAATIRPKPRSPTCQTSSENTTNRFCTGMAKTMGNSPKHIQIKIALWLKT